MSNLSSIGAMMINVDGGSIFEIFPGQTGRFQEGQVSNPAVIDGLLKLPGIIDTETLTMPISYRLDFDIAHIELQIRSIALAILNDKVVPPATPIAPDSYRAVMELMEQEENYLSVKCFSWPHEKRSLGCVSVDTGGALLEGTTGSTEHPYTIGLECLTKIAEVLSAYGYEFEFNTIEQFNSGYLITDLPDWCPLSDYKPVSVGQSGYQIGTAQDQWDRFVDSLQNPS